MKLTSIQLRKIIAEEVAAVLDEASGDDMNGVVDAATLAFRDAAPAFDEGDPSMAAGGPESWEEQLDAAEEDFRNGVAELLDGVMSRLQSGEYAR